MKILLIGEYSRLHNSLKEGLVEQGHEVLLIGTEDGFKNFDVDIHIGSKIAKYPILKFINLVLYKLLNINCIEREHAYRFRKLLPILKDYDVVQLINERAIKCSPEQEIKLIKKVKQQNKKIVLLSCGVDYTSVKYALDKKFRYSVLTPYLENPALEKEFKYVLIYNTEPYFKLHKFLHENSNGVIASDLDYHIPLKNEKNYLGLIPNPVNYKKLEYVDLSINEKIIIFHGINSANYTKKGNVFFEKALHSLKEKYNDKVEIIVTTDIKYKEYIKLYNSAHIVLDQVYAYDQGYNALEAMAKGKVVFTGAEQEWLDFYNLEADTVAINALPNEVDIFKKLEWLILNPENIINISKNARAFIEKEHDYVAIAKRYVSVWENA
ncbi:glycosyltransferase [Lacinutrix salivirga]